MAATRLLAWRPPARPIRGAFSSVPNNAWFTSVQLAGSASMAFKSRGLACLPAMRAHPWSAYVAPAAGGWPPLVLLSSVNHLLRDVSAVGCSIPQPVVVAPLGGPAGWRGSQRTAGRVVAAGRTGTATGFDATVRLLGPKKAVGAGTPLSGAQLEREGGSGVRGVGCVWGIWVQTMAGGGSDAARGTPPPRDPSCIEVLSQAALPPPLPLPRAKGEYLRGPTRWQPPCCRAPPHGRVQRCSDRSSPLRRHPAVRLSALLVGGFHG